MDDERRRVVKHIGKCVGMRLNVYRYWID